MKARSIVALFVLAVLAVLGMLAVACGAAGAEVKVDKGLAAVAGANLASVQQESGQGSLSAAPAALVNKVSVPGSVAATGGSVAIDGGGPALAREVSAYAPATSGGLAPLEQAGPLGIVAQGFGRATAPADTARVQFVVSKSGEIYPVPLQAEPKAVPEGYMPGETAPATPPEIYPTPTPPSPIAEADLQPLVDAIKAQGVSDSDIQVTIYPSSYYGTYDSQSARVTATLRDPKRTGELIGAGNQAVAESGTLFIQNVGVIYSVNNCDTLLKEARKAAVEDARANGAGLAEALGVGLGDIQGASEYSYDPYGYSTCQPQSGPLYYEYEGPSFNPAQPAEVQIVSNVTISFAMS
jgi:uncharacterized protein YggE